MGHVALCHFPCRQSKETCCHVSFTQKLYLNYCVVVASVWYHSAGTNPFLTDGLWPSGLFDGHCSGWLMASLRFRVPGSKLVSNSWHNSLIIGMYPVACALNFEIEMPFECAQWAHQPFQMSVITLLGPIGFVGVWLHEQESFSAYTQPMRDDVTFKKVHLKVLSAKWRPFCLGLNVLKTTNFCQGVQWSGKSQGNSRLGKSQGKVREFCWRSGKKMNIGKSQGKVREFAFSAI